MINPLSHSTPSALSIYPHLARLLSTRMTSVAASMKFSGRRSGVASAGTQLGAACSSTAVSIDGRPQRDVSC
eukprot:366157-Chlamydomonas_euryale.AAC.2